MYPTITNFDQLTHLCRDKGNTTGIIASYDYIHGIITVCYTVVGVDTFTGPDEDLKRECRGISFDLDTGEVLSRPYPKFFNFNERDDTRMEDVDFSAPHDVLVKLDGSMVVPVMTRLGLRLATKRGITPAAKRAFANFPESLRAFSMEMLDRGITPIFEWITSNQRIVINYGEEDRFVVTAMRETETGRFLTRDEQVFIKISGPYVLEMVASANPITSPREWTDIVRALDGVEGFVVAFADGRRFKAKTDWYRAIHTAIDGMKWEKDVIRLICDDYIDDAKAAVTDEIRAALEAFHADFLNGVNISLDMIIANAHIAHGQGLDARETFSLYANDGMAGYIMIAYKCIASGRPVDRVAIMREILRLIGRKCGSASAVDEVRYLHGASWYPYSNNITSLAR